MGKGNYYFNANVGYILLEEFDEKFVSVLCIANNKKYSFLDKDILNDFEEKLFVSKNMVDFYTKENSLCKLINVLLDECDKNKPFKFKILKKLKNLKLAEKTNIRI